jgi:RNA polymerase sigma-70 factor, ECF subfamily
MTAIPPTPSPSSGDIASPHVETTTGRLWRALTTGRQRRLVRVMEMSELVRGAAQGSREHHGELCRRVHDPMLVYARHLTRDDDEAVDLLQDVYAALPQTLARYHDRGQFVGWLRGVVFNRWRTRARTARHRAEESLGDTDVPGTGRTITTEIAQRDLIDRALRGMPGATRETWVLFTEGLSPQEIATRLEISYGAVNVRLTRARQYLLQHLARLV